MRVDKYLAKVFEKDRELRQLDFHVQRFLHSVVSENSVEIKRVLHVHDALMLTNPEVILKWLSFRENSLQTLICGEEIYARVFGRKRNFETQVPVKIGINSFDDWFPLLHGHLPVEFVINTQLGAAREEIVFDHVFKPD